MNYRHLYHAGSFSDVFKHLTLVVLIQALLKKDKPFCYLDTHAGTGRYDLLSEPAQKTREYEQGIATLLKQKEVSPAVAAYFQAIQAINSQDIYKRLQFYPGSPSFVRHFLRPDDQMILTELHPEELQALKQEFYKDNQVAVHHQDGYQALKAFLPPKQRRGLVLIDPPFEKTDEFDQIVKKIKEAYKRWPTGVYAVWYPLKNLPQVDRFYRQLANADIPQILCLEMAIYPKDTPQGLNGTGMIIINPPWQVDQQLAKLIPWLWQVLSPEKQGDYSVKWLA